jgi:hypothetical protein
METDTPNLLTAGRIAAVLGVPLGRVTYILNTRPHIRPRARAGVLRLYNKDALVQVQNELQAIAARRGGQGVAHG